MEKAYDISHLEHTNDKYDGLQKIEASGTGDVALKLVSHTHGLTLSRAEEKGYLRRIDLILMPPMFITFGLQYMDKSLLSAAAQSGIIQDLHLYTVDSQGLNLMRYSYCTMIFYWGYFTGAFPAAYLSQRAPLGRYAGIAIAVWGAITLATVGVKSYGGFLVQRFFLGFTEAAISPAFSLITAMWYKRDEQPLRIAIWYSSTGFGGLVGSLVAYSIGHIKGPLAPWKYQYLIIGSITVIWGFLIFFLLPNNPLAAWFLNQNHRILAVHRMKAEQTGLENKRFKWYQAREALLDPKNWLLVLMTLCTHMVNGGVSGFGTIIVRSFGYSPLKSVLMVGCVGVVVLGSLLISGFVSVYIQDMRVYIAVVCSMFVIAGASAIWKLSWASHAGPMAGFCILGFFAVSYVMILALMNANTAGHTKKAVTAGMIWAAYCVANGVSPLLILAPEEPTHYPTEFKTIIGALSANICIGLGLRFYLARENKSRNTVSLAEGQDLELTAYADLTDRENPNFRFCL